MIQNIDPVPNPLAPLVPYLSVKGAEAAIEFYKKAFGAEEIYRLHDPDGRISHAELRIGMAQIMLAEEYPELSFKAPHNENSVVLHLYLKDVDRFVEKAVVAGLKVQQELKDQFYGDRSGRFIDPFGHVWILASQKENLSVDEIQRRATKL